MSLNLRVLTAAAVFAVGLSLSASGGAPSLAPRVLVPLGPENCDPNFTCSSDPQEIVAVDLDGDGVLDFATANNGSDDVTILLNTGTGSFRLEATLAAGSGPAGIGAADFDGDGNADLAVLNLLDSEVSIFKGSGDGSFASPTTVAVGREPGSFPEAIVVHDFDSDGNADFATANHFEDTVTVHLGNGDGTFADAIVVDVAIAPFALAVGDFNEDGVADLVVTLDESSPGEVAILIGDGTGNFSVQAARPATGDSPIAVAVGDLDGDGFADLATANWFDDTVSVLFGNGDGTFVLGPVLDAGILPEAVEIADIDGDGAADIVTLDSLGSDEADGLLLVIPGVGDGTFDAVESFAVGASPGAIVVADLNGDDALDVATTHFDSDDVAVLLNGPVGPACVGDCNGDGMVSIAELITGVNVALGRQPITNCTAFDRDSNGSISIAELIAGVNSALRGCGA